MSDDITFTDYKGPSRVAGESPWLTSEDLPHDKETPVTIERVVRADNVKFRGGRVVPVVIGLKFVEGRRILKTNTGHRTILNAAFSPDRGNTEDWVGKKLILYVVQGVSRGDGTEGPAVRIKVPQA